MKSSPDMLCLDLVSLLRQHTEQKPHKRIYTYLLDGESEEAHLTYAQLEEQARAIAALLQAHNASGERALLLYPPGLAYIAAFMGCLFANVVAVPAYPPDPTRLNRTLPRLQAIAADSQAKIVLTIEPVLQMASFLFSYAPDLEALDWLATDTVDKALATVWQQPSINQDSLAFLQYTSGSTAAAKGTMLTHRNLCYNLAQIHRCFGHSEDSQGVIWLPPYHDMGLIGGILQPLYGDFPVVLMSPIDFLKRPFRWLQAVSRYQATTSGGPNFAYELCVRKITPEQRATLDLSHWDVAFNGAEPVRYETLRRFAEVFTPAGFRYQAFYPCYGLAEATLIATGGVKETTPVVQAVNVQALAQDEVMQEDIAHPAAQTVVGCGHSLIGQQLVVVNPQTCQPCPNTKVGEIWLSGPGVAAGYWNQPEETMRAFHAFLANGTGPFLRTGDLGFLQDGELFITGRLKDLIIIRGQNYYPDDIEQTITQSHSALRPGCGAAFSVPIEGEERLIHVQEVDASISQSRRNSDARLASDVDLQSVFGAVRQAVARMYQLQLHGVVLIKPHSIPKTSSGKIQRQATRSAFLAGELDKVGESFLQDVSTDGSLSPKEADLLPAELPQIENVDDRQILTEQYLQQRIAQTLQIDPAQFDIHRPLNELGLDSLTAIALEHEIEKVFQVTLSEAALLQGTNIAGLARQIATGIEATPLAAEVNSPATLAPTNSFSLTHGQKGIWFLHQLAPESAAYHIVCAARILSVLDVPAFQRAFGHLMQRHPALRTTFSILAGEPVQQVNTHMDLDFQVEDASTWDEADLRQALISASQRPFDLQQSPLWRVHLFQQTERETVLLFVVHHIVADFWSLAVLIQDLGRLYEAERENRPLPPLPGGLQYADYARWQNERLDGSEGARLWAYWQQQLQGTLPPLNMPGDYPRPAIQTFRGRVKIIRLSPEVTQKITTLARSQGATLYMTLLAAYLVLLHRYTNQDEVLVGSAVAGRNRAAFTQLVGYFTNSIVLRSKLAGNPSFLTFLEQVRQTVLAALVHQEYPLRLLVEQLHPERNVSRSPLFQTMFLLQKSPLPEMQQLAAFALGETGIQLNLNGLMLETVTLEKQTSQFDLTLSAADLPGGLRIACEYNSDLFAAEYIDDLLRHYQLLLESIVSHPAQRVLLLPMLPAEESKRLLQTWNNTQVNHPRPYCLHQLFLQQAAQTPAATAITFADHYLTYAALSCHAHHVARYLRRQGVGPETVVGLYMDRSVEMIVGLLGILLAGGAYLPLDPTHPPQRLTFVLQDAQVPWLLTQPSLKGNLPAYQGKVISINEIGDDYDTAPDDDLQQDIVSEDNLAYVIYTSGSTGQPKGVQVTHRAVVNFLRSMRVRPGLESEDVLLSVTPLSFDIAGMELFLPLIVGARCVLAQADEVIDGPRLAAAIHRCDATVMQATPATWQLLFEARWSGSNQLKILCGGEALSRDLANRLAGCSSALWNMYGPTETTIWSTTDPVEEGEGLVFIGSPIDNTQIYVLDNLLNLAPVGVPGNLYIGGAGLARGYIHRPSLTAERFIPNPFSLNPGERLYHTGDMARYRADGRIEFLGRIDHQVKVRGYRIELAEIEAALHQEPAVRDAVVVAHDDGAGSKRLVAYVIPAEDKDQTNVAELRRNLQLKLPDYMLPSVFVAVTAFPLTPNGKINRLALPAPDNEYLPGTKTYVMPAPGWEQHIAAIWQQVLQVERVSTYDNFFDLGGHSLLMAKIKTLLQDTLPIPDLAMVELFQYPTVHGLAQYLSQKQEVPATSLFSQERVRIRQERQDIMQWQRQRRQNSRRKTNE